tara:strand:- start:3006 stop:4346 length:1341 start_codon:yes stop_codon:yes gene_type:complete
MAKSISSNQSDLLENLKKKKSNIGIIGMGYVGLPLAYAFSKKNFKVIGFDTDKDKVEKLNKSESYIKHISNKKISLMLRKDFHATTNFQELSSVDIIVICVPTPLKLNRSPDLSHIKNTAVEIEKYLNKGQLIILESSTYPGTTDEELCKLLEGKKYKRDKDFFLAYSPEREDPGNKKFSTPDIPKIVGSNHAFTSIYAKELYKTIIKKVIVVENTKTAEAIKLTENIYRSVNIALVNELKVIYEAMGIDVWKVIEGAKTKPFGFQAFYPGPGLGGHCIPIDPFYLSYKSDMLGIPARFIELAGEINRDMPDLIVKKIINYLRSALPKTKKNTKVLIIGLAYKKDVDDMRESPSLYLLEKLHKKGIEVDFFDPLIKIIPKNRDHKKLEGKKSIVLNKNNLERYDAVLISTDHTTIDFKFIGENSKLIFDTRNAMDKINSKSKIIKI